MTTGARLGLLAGLYVAQGLPQGFFTQALPAILRREGVSLVGVGLANLLALPWALKFLVAPWADGRAPGRLGRRRGVILPAQAASVVALAALAWFDPSREGLAPLLAVTLLVNVLAALQDVATDGLAVELLRPDERGLGNGVQVGGYRLGMILGGGGLLVVSPALGWWGTLLALAGALAAASLPALRHAEAPPPPAGPRAARAGWPRLADWVDRPGGLGWLAAIAAFKGGHWLGTAMLRPMLVDAGWGLDDLGWLLGSAGFTAGLAGAAVGGAATGRLGRRRAVVLFGALDALTLAAYAVLALGELAPGPTAAVCALEHLTSGMATAALFTAMMDACRADRAATDFTVQACVVVIGSGLAAAVSGWSAERLLYPGHFALAAALAAAGVAVIAWYLGRPGAPRLHG